MCGVHFCVLFFMLYFVCLFGFLFTNHNKQARFEGKGGGQGRGGRHGMRERGEGILKSR